ncbi:hypothetical protein [Alkalihalobacillus trypoxylicola]|uniref:hypothetical protein n=1 Tax=Alkalihalobacillus trypoxylicola TaxID=519424 RepID=UPI0007851E82|nr:hypothetical protein [Alkalihalobacillus trypoxylicola]
MKKYILGVLSLAILLSFIVQIPSSTDAHILNKMISASVDVNSSTAINEFSISTSDGTLENLSIGLMELGSQLLVVASFVFSLLTLPFLLSRFYQSNYLILSDQLLIK